MNNLFILCVLFFFSNSYFAQVTTVDYTALDCQGVSHNLYNELDQGKIIVMSFVMPCATCAAPSLAAYNAVQSYSVSHPNKVFFYLVDDYANTSCATLTTWGNNSSLFLSTKFANVNIDISNYGVYGMPKVVVVGGSDHAEVYNRNSGVTTQEVQDVIDALLLAEISELNEENSLNINIYPNPVNDKMRLDYSLTNSSSINIEIYSLVGSLKYKSAILNQGPGLHSYNIGEYIQLETGNYILKLTTDFNSESINFSVEK